MCDLITRSCALLFAVAMVIWAVAGDMNTTNAMDSKNSESSLAKEDATEKDTKEDQNPLLAKWSGKYGGVPPFDRVQVALFKPALEAAMAEQLGEVEKIARDPALRVLKTPSSPWNEPAPHSIASQPCTVSGQQP